MEFCFIVSRIFLTKFLYFITCCFTDGITIKANFASLYKILIPSSGLIRIY